MTDARPNHATDNADRQIEASAGDEVVADEPMTRPQRAYLHTLAREAGEDVPEPEPSKADASVIIERLQRATGRIPADRAR
jgi:Protein of unknown function (DUF3072)